MQATGQQGISAQFFSAYVPGAEVSHSFFPQHTARNIYTLQHTISSETYNYTKQGKFMKQNLLCFHGPL